jgi:hypothetical protein
VSTDRLDAGVRNRLLIGLLAPILLFTAFQEGYLPLISVLFGAALAGALAFAFWLAPGVSTTRLACLLLGIFVIEYVKETIGVRDGLWVYHGAGGGYVFGVWAWVLGGVVSFLAATRLVGPFLARRLPRPPDWTKPVLLLAVAATIPLTLGPDLPRVGILFWCLYGLLLAGGLLAASRMSASLLLGIVLTSWIVGNPSEYAGSVGSGVWTFPGHPGYPPVFLLLGCWPLEILAQFGLSALLAGESLDGAASC